MEKRKKLVKSGLGKYSNIWRNIKVMIKTADIIISASSICYNKKVIDVG